MTGDTTSRTITDITTDRTASEVHGTGADTTTLGTVMHGDGVHGHTALGAITDGTTHGTTEDSMTHGTTADSTEDSTTLGIMEDGAGTIGTDITTILSTADGMADGTRIITDISMDRDTYRTSRENITSHSKARDIRPDPTESSQEAHLSEAVQLSKAFQAEVQERYQVPHPPAGRLRQEQAVRHP